MRLTQFKYFLSHHSYSDEIVSAMIAAYEYGAEHERLMCSDICNALRDNAQITDVGRREALFTAARQIDSRVTT